MFFLSALLLFFWEELPIVAYNILYSTQDIHKTIEMKVMIKYSISGLHFIFFVCQIILFGSTYSSWLTNSIRSLFVNAIHVIQYYC